MSSTSAFGSASHFGNMGSWKAGSPTSNPLLLKAQSRQLFIMICSSLIAQLRAQSMSCNPNLGHNPCIVRNKSWRPQLRDQTLCFSAWDWFFSEVATKGRAWFMMQPYCRTGGGYCALRNLLLVKTGCLEFQNGTAGMDVLNKHVEQFFFRQCVTFCELGSWKTGSPTSNQVLLKAQSRQPFFDLQQSDSTTESTINVL